MAIYFTNTRNHKYKKLDKVEFRKEWCNLNGNIKTQAIFVNFKDPRNIRNWSLNL